MADQNALSQIMGQLSPLMNDEGMAYLINNEHRMNQQNLQGPGFGMTGPGVPVGGEPIAMYPGGSAGATMPGQGGPMGIQGLMQQIMTQNPGGNYEFLNGLLSGIFAGPTPPAMGRVPSAAPGTRMPPSMGMGRPGGFPGMPGMPGTQPPMQGPGFGMTGPGAPVSPIAGPGGAFGNARTNQPAQTMPQMPSFGNMTKKPY